MMKPQAAPTVLMLLLLATPGCGIDDKAPASSKKAPGCDPNATWTVWVTNQGPGVDTVTVFHNHGDEQVSAEILATIPVGRAPHNIAFSPDAKRAYVANLGTPPANGSVSVIDVGTYKVIASVEAGVKAHGIAVTPDGKSIWVVNTASDDITIIDAETLAAEPDRIKVGDGPALVAFLPDGTKAYVSNGDDGTASVIDVASRKVTKTIPTGKGAMGLVLGPEARFLFETDGLDDRITVIDTKIDEVANVITFDETLKGPHSIAIAGWEAMITNRTADSLSFIDTRTLEKVASMSVPGRPDILAVAPTCDRAYLTLRDVVGVAVVDVSDRKYLDIIGMGTGDVHGIAVLPEGGKAGTN
ncbi:MAG: YncE family protein [Deltaproteobacteria bacterium]|nr:YncE family protein [Deltaproteobacteria bacterium]